MLASYFPLALAACSNQNDLNSPNSKTTSKTGNTGKFVSIGTTAQLTANGYLLNEKSKVLVVQQDNQLFAVNPVCTHRGCIVDLDKESNLLTCPCHHAKFDLDGEVLAEPATEPLSTYEVKEENDEILVKLP